MGPALLAGRAFDASATPSLIVDDRLRICSVNAAYVAATGQPDEALIGVDMFDAFPDNPDVADADGVARLSASFEHVLSRSSRHRMSLQRYDVRDRSRPGAFTYKVWSPVNSPIRDEEGRVVGVLHQVEDVTALFPQGTGQEGHVGPVEGLSAVEITALFVSLRQQREVSTRLQSQVESLSEALQTNRVISTAVGLLMAATGGDRESAFRLLVTQSQHSHRKLREVAEDLVRDHEQARDLAPRSTDGAATL